MIHIGALAAQTAGPFLAAPEMHVRPTRIAHAMVAARANDVATAVALLQGGPAVRAGFGESQQSELGLFQLLSLWSALILCAGHVTVHHAM